MATVTMILVDGLRKITLRTVDRSVTLVTYAISTLAWIGANSIFATPVDTPGKSAQRYISGVSGHRQ
jgi:hypothetical protein